MGVWLAVKENGEALQKMLSWTDLPLDANDNTKFLDHADIEKLSDSFLDMLFQFKHRGAISITAETLAHFIKSLLNSKNPNY